MTVLFFSIFAASAQNADKALPSYYALKNALVKGDNQEASKTASSLQASIKEEKHFNEKESLLKLAAKIAEAGDIEQQRASFNELSEQMWKWVKKSERLSSPAYYQYCPMKKSYWLSEEKEIKNPYYGSAMLNCGKVVETKQ